MSHDCDELLDAAEAKDRIVAERERTLAETRAEHSRLTGELDELARSWGGEGEWRDLELALTTAYNTAAAAVGELEGQVADAAAEASALEDAFDDLERLTTEAAALESRWVELMEQLSGDRGTDMSVPQSGLMAAVEQVRAELDAKLDEIEECHARIASMLSDGDPRTLEERLETARATLEAAGDERENWLDASTDLKQDLLGVHPDSAAQALETAEQQADAAWDLHDRHCLP